MASSNNLFNKIIFEKIVSEKDADIKKRSSKIRNEEKVRNSTSQNDEIIITEDHVSWLSGHSLKLTKKNIL